jgi:EmrB/QacA subfamily drug resistance transporter
MLSYTSAQGRWVVAATVLGSGMASLDATVVGIALPRIGVDFGVGVSSLQWVVTAYTLTLAAFLLLGGTLGDHYGRRRIFTFGIIWFTAASLLCAVAPNATTLIAARALQGVGAALLTPGSLAILQSSFRPEDRARAIGAWSGFGALANAGGPILGGYLLSLGSWRWLFLLNLPVAAMVLAVTQRHVPESSDSSATGRIDLPGAAVAVLALSTLTFGLIEAPDLGWSSPAVAGCLTLGVVAFVAFFVIEQRSEAPMLPPEMFTARQFTATNAVTFLVYGALGGVLFLLPVALQQVADYTPLQAGLTLVPVTILMFSLSAASGRLASRIGPRLQMSLGPLLAGVGIVLLLRLTGDHAYISGVLPGVLLLGIGLVVTVAPLTATAMSSAPGAHAGLASAVNNDVARAAGLLAVAVLPVVTGLTGDAYLHPDTFAQGFRMASVIAGSLCFAGGLLAAVTISNAEPCTAEHHPMSQPCVGATAPELSTAATE